MEVWVPSFTFVGVDFDAIIPITLFTYLFHPVIVVVLLLFLLLLH